MLKKMKYFMEGLRNIIYKVFLDTNILLDYLIEERKENAQAKEIIRMIANDKLEGYICPISLLNIYYVLRTQRTEEQRMCIIENFLHIFTVSDMDSEILHLGLFTQIKDYEDSVQYICAEKSGVDLIVTGDQHFKSYNLDLPRLTSAELLHRIT
jgi:predicted nucleic acid-binding protein